MGTGLTSGFIPAAWWWSHCLSYPHPSNGRGAGGVGASPPRGVPSRSSARGGLGELPVWRQPVRTPGVAAQAELLGTDFTLDGDRPRQCRV